jgi:uncharacterized protein (DUF2126 family)/transglutaminase-like putative cysteine protease
VSIHIALNHVTHYRYDRLINLGPQILRLRPAPHCRTRVLSYSLRVTPGEHFINWQQDPQANYLARLVFPSRTREFRIEVDVVAEMAVVNPFDFFLEPHAEHFPFAYAPESAHELAPFRLVEPATPLLAAYLADIPRERHATMDFLVELNQRLQRETRYLIRLEPGVQTPEETLRTRAGSCRDSSWLLVNILRHLGFAARFVSGYLVQLVPDVKPLDGPAGPPADFTDLHAWCEVYLPGAGWIGLDPTSGLLAGEGHLPLAASPDPQSAAPVTGSIDECEVEFSHEMQVTRIWEAPRVTKPYTESQWSALLQLGQQVEADLQRHDVRLTQGGEPTFVSVDDHDGAEWNTDALGPTKQPLARELLARLRAHYAPLGLTHYGQGKWYPGEQLPRWSLNLYWRRDGEPLWRDQALLAGDGDDLGATPLQGERFLHALAARLDVGMDHVFPAFEDTWYYLWRERRLPSNVDPLASNLADPVERARLRRLFADGLQREAGHVLPLRHEAGRWQSGRWFLRDERCYLVPGDSPLGLRLPLDSLPWAREEDLPLDLPPDPAAPRGELPVYMALRTRHVAPVEPRRQAAGDGRGIGAAAAERAPRAQESAAWITRTALCAEPRGGALHLFMPPLARLEDYLELLSAIEETAVALGTPVVIEGYEPPRDPRLQHLRVTPDPGVIEVNVHPVESWPALVEQTEFLYEAAHQTRLSSEKFMMDGRHSGTGGGNHFVLGGATVGDSPFLRRPDLLASMLAYWHNHPSLSYLFSGMFIGPTSQAPRIDEGRHESVYEMEIALRELQRQQQAQQETSGGEVTPWLVDRIFRNLLVDITGNTHRAEFCIDKMFSPDSATGRLGLLELRAFEMPPHPRMSLAQQLLMRALVSRFWQHPYRPLRLQRWSTELHDRFMLPHFVWDDFRDVLAELADFGYALDPAWFAPHLEFRFPRLGDFAARNVEVELRAALEPWHVLGEENAAGGTARYVDSSLERLQVRVRGLVDGRHAVTCNGHAVPLHATGTNGEYVAGVRYRAWQPPSCLQPTIGVHSPLTFDLVDTWQHRSLGGCQYHVTHPGGRNYSSFPVNAFEAESRRLARFFRFGHTPGELRVAPATRSAHFPFTLDLRRIEG